MGGSVGPVIQPTQISLSCFVVIIVVAVVVVMAAAAMVVVVPRPPDQLVLQVAMRSGGDRKFS